MNILQIVEIKNAKKIHTTIELCTDAWRVDFDQCQFLASLIIRRNMRKMTKNYRTYVEDAYVYLEKVPFKQLFLPPHMSQLDEKSIYWLVLIAINLRVM